MGHTQEGEDQARVEVSRAGEGADHQDEQAAPWEEWENIKSERTMLVDTQAGIKEQRAKFKAHKAAVDDQKANIMVFHRQVEPHCNQDEGER